jgi:hypothetical protein
MSIAMAFILRIDGPTDVSRQSPRRGVEAR